jgi:Trypsin
VLIAKCGQIFQQLQSDKIWAALFEDQIMNMQKRLLVIKMLDGCKVLLLLACVAFAQGIYISSISIFSLKYLLYFIGRFHRKQRIFGGTAAAVGEFPWQVSLQYAPCGIPFCSGVIIDELHIVTAGHCTVYAVKLYPELLYQFCSLKVDQIFTFSFIATFIGILILFLLCCI